MLDLLVQFAARLALPIGRGRRWRWHHFQSRRAGRSRLSRAVRRKQHAPPVVQRGARYIHLRLQRGQRIAGQRTVVELQCVDAVGADDAGKRRQLHAFILAMAQHAGNRKSDKHDQQRGRCGYQRHGRQFLVKAGALEIAHGIPVDRGCGAGQLRTRLALRADRLIPAGKIYGGATVVILR
jgi:hypothetical protein